MWSYRSLLEVICALFLALECGCTQDPNLARFARSIQDSSTSVTSATPPSTPPPTSTSPPQPTPAPNSSPASLKISAVGAIASSTQVIVTWQTNLAATTQVAYGTSTSYGQSSSLNTFVLSHAVTISGLTPNTLYHFQVSSSDTQGNRDSSADTTFMTGALGTGALPTGIGWHSLGSPDYVRGSYLDTALKYSPPDGQGSTNQCPMNYFGGTTYTYFNKCGGVISAQSSGVADTHRNVFYIWGGGHGDYAGNEMYKLDLNSNPVSLRRVKNPTTPPTTMDPHYLPAAGLPEDQNTQTYTIAAISRNAAGVVTVHFDSPTHFAPYIYNGGLFGKYYIVIAGVADPTLIYFSTGPLPPPNTGVFPVSSAASTIFSNDTVTYKTGVLNAPVSYGTGGTAATTWSSCVPDPNGHGCSPNAIHSTQSLVMVSNTADHSKDVFMKVSGSVASGEGSSDGTFWSVPLEPEITNDSQWTWLSHKDNFTPQGTFVGKFPVEAAYDTTTQLTYVLESGNGFWAYDYYGSQGPANKLYRLGSVNNSSMLSGAIWHSNGDTARYFYGLGGCSEFPLVSISRRDGIVTAVFPYRPEWTMETPITNFPVWIYGVNDTSFNSGDGTHNYSIVTNVSAATATWATANTTSSSSSGGYVITCGPLTKTGTVAGVLAANITAGAVPVTFEDWTTATMDQTNLDVGNPSLGNTCAEYLAGGEHPSNQSGSGALGVKATGISPGITLDTVTGNLVGWPNQGSSVYFIMPDPAHNRWTCKRMTYPASDPTAAPQDTNNAGGPRSSWGTWTRFSYFPALDVFLLINDPAQPARILRIR